MIVWLASYPRSGNTLLRQVLKQCLGMESYEGPGVETAGAPAVTDDAWREARVAYGNRFATESRAAFLAAAREAPERVLVKTHELPGDDEPAVYVVRDGRLALQSYVKFRDTYEGGAGSFASMLVGDHHYRDWTTHYERWCEKRTGPLLVLRFEELVNADMGLLTRLADFVGHAGPVTPWVNPQVQLQQLVPAFFGPGRTRWRPDDFWSDERLRQFCALHGPLMGRLGYLTAGELTEWSGAEAETLRELYRVTQARWHLQQVCDERTATMEQLRLACDAQTALAERLHGDCAERLALIERLSAACGERERRVAELEQACEERLGIIRRLEAQSVAAKVVASVRRTLKMPGRRCA